MAGASQVILTQGDAPQSVPSGKSAFFVGADGVPRVQNNAGNVIILQDYSALPSLYNRDICWSAADKLVLSSPNKMAVNVADVGFSIFEQVTIDLSVAANWDPTSALDFTVAANRAGKNFYYYACKNGSELKLLLSSNSTYPGNYTATTSRKMGGFHCLCVSAGTISGHTLSGYIAGDILPASVWDLMHRPVSAPEGMVYVTGIGLWADIYLASISNGQLVSVHGGTIADGTSSSPVFNWYDFAEWLGRIGKRLPTQLEFMGLAMGSNEGTNIYGSADPGTTGGHVDTNSQRMISNFGIEDCAGAMWQWLLETGGMYDTTATWIDQYDAGRTDQRGQGYAVPTRGIAGGSWGNGANCGSRSSLWANSPLDLAAGIGARGVAEPLAVAL